MTPSSQAVQGGDSAVAERLAMAALLRRHLKGAGVGEQLAALDRLDSRHVTASAASADPGGLPVLAHLAEAVALASAGLDQADGEALAAVAASVAWTQTAVYRLDPPHDRFLDGYAHATFLGPTDGEPLPALFPVSLPDSSPAGAGPAAVGLLLLAPGVVYPHHDHPADEIYLPLTEARWSHSDGAPFEVEAAGIALRHRPSQPHAMIAGACPLLALYLWTGAVTVPAAWTRTDPPADGP